MIQTIQTYRTTSTIRNLIQETNDAYAMYSTLNTDYAAFASLSLEDFRRYLNSPGLTGRQLRLMIRNAMIEHKDQCPASCWATYVSSYITDRSNDNI